jgi:hypothetical protein
MKESSMAVEDRGASAAPRRGRRAVVEDSGMPFTSQWADARGAEAVRAYWCALLGLLPGVGLLLGPLAFVLALWTGLRGRRDPAFKGGALCIAAVVLGLLLTLTQWSGLALMIRGLQGD